MLKEVEKREKEDLWPRLKKGDEVQWSEVRNAFPEPSECFPKSKIRVYFNDASIGIPSKLSSLAARMEYTKLFVKRVDLDKNFQEQLELVEETRKRVAKLLGTKAENIIFDNNTTEVMKLAAAMVLKKGDHLITTSGEYAPSMRVFFDSLYRLPKVSEMHAERDIQFGQLHIREFTAVPERFEDVGITMQNFALSSGAVQHGHPQFIQVIGGDRRYHDVKMKVVKLGESDEEIVSIIEKAITPKTKLIVVSHVLRQDGSIMPVREIADMVREHSKEDRPLYFLVDGAQALGNLHPRQLRVEKIGCDFYTGCSHKTGLSEPATGFLFVNERNRKLIQNLLEPNLYFPHFPLFELKAFQFHPDNQPVDMFKGYDGKVEPRTVNDWAGLDDRTMTEFKRISTPEIASFDISLQIFEFIGWDNAQKRITDLREYAVDKLRAIPGVVLEVSEKVKYSPAILSFSLEGKDSAKVIKELSKRGIETTYIPQCGSIRLSFSIRNNEWDVDKLVEELREISSGKPKTLE